LGNDPLRTDVEVRLTCCVVAEAKYLAVTEPSGSSVQVVSVEVRLPQKRDLALPFGYDSQFRFLFRPSLFHRALSDFSPTSLRRR
jgi:hypothetical protein